MYHKVIYYYLYYFFLNSYTYTDNFCSYIYQCMVTETFKKSIYKIEIIDIKEHYTRVIYTRPLYDVLLSFIGILLKKININITKTFCIQNIPDTIIQDYKNADLYFNITTWDNDTILVHCTNTNTKELNLKKENKFIIVMIQCPIKLDITFFINNNNYIFNGKDTMNLNDILLLMYFLNFIDNKTMVYLLCNIHDIVISKMDRDLNETILRYSQKIQI